MWMDGGVWNLKVNRDPKKVRVEVRELLGEYHLDWLVVLEAWQYTNVLRDIHKYDYIVDPSSKSSRDCGILIRQNIPHGPGHTRRLTQHGWEGQTGRHHWHRSVVECNINHVGVGGFHYPPGGPKREVFQEAAERTVQLTKRRSPNRSLLYVGDWNEPVKATGVYTPRWVARKSGLLVVHDGPGTIDYGMHRGLETGGINRPRFGDSDHRPFLIGYSNG